MKTSGIQKSINSLLPDIALFLVWPENKAVQFSLISLSLKYHNVTAVKIIHRSACDGKACIGLTSIIWKCECAEMKQMWDGGNALEGI